jgi:hypothetical protein
MQILPNDSIHDQCAEYRTSSLAIRPNTLPLSHALYSNIRRTVFPTQIYEMNAHGILCTSWSPSTNGYVFERKIEIV